MVQLVAVGHENGLKVRVHGTKAGPVDAGGPQPSVVHRFLESQSN